MPLIGSGGTAVESAFGMLGADVPPSGSATFTPGGRTAIRRATVAGSGHWPPLRARVGICAGQSDSPTCVRPIFLISTRSCPDIEIYSWPRTRIGMF